jgi:hypothetical protein
MKNIYGFVFRNYFCTQAGKAGAEESSQYPALFYIVFRSAAGSACGTDMGIDHRAVD